VPVDGESTPNVIIVQWQSHFTQQGKDLVGPVHLGWDLSAEPVSDASHVGVHVVDGHLGVELLRRSKERRLALVKLVPIGFDDAGRNVQAVHVDTADDADPCSPA
jgi:hypothetical protein